MDCQAARLLLWFKRPQAKELSLDDEAALARHCAECPECDRFARLFAQENRALGRAVRAVPVPPGLKESLLASVNFAAATHASARRALWRRAAAGLSLDLLVGIGLFLFWLWSPPPPFHLREMEWFGHSRFSLPVDSPAANKIEWLESHFGNQGAWARVPSALRDVWDFSCLSTAYVEDFTGGKVGVAEFKKAGGHAVVFFLPKDRCRPEELTQYEGQRDIVRVLRGRPDDPFLALVFLKEGMLDQFLLKPR